MGTRGRGAVETATVAAFRLMDRAYTPELPARLRSECLAVLEHGHRLPEALIDAALGSGDLDLQRALVANQATGLATLMALARLGRPELGLALYRRHFVEDTDVDGVRSAVLAAADPGDPRWYEPGALAPWLANNGAPMFLAPALYAPFGDALARALLRLGPDLPADLFLDRCRALRELVGPEGFAAFARTAAELDDLAHPGLLARIDDEPTGAPHAGGPWLVRIRHNHAGGRPGPIDWDVVRAEHARRPFGGWSLALITARPDCPEDLVRLAHRVAPDLLVAHHLPPDLLLGPDVDRAAAWWFTAVRFGLRQGWLSAERVLAVVAPAKNLARALTYEAPSGVRAAVADVIAPLGADRAAWTAVYASLAHHRGTLAELVADVLRARETGTLEPYDLEHPVVAPSGPARSVFRALLDCATPDVCDVLVPMLDTRAVRELLASEETRAHIRARVIAVHGRTTVLARSTIEEQTPDSIRELLDLDDLDVNAALFRHAPLVHAQRVRILAGTDRAGLPGAVPLSDDVLRALGDVDVRRARDRLVAGLASGDPRVVRVILGRTRLRTAAAYRMLVALWERSGPEEVRAILDETSFPGRAATRHPLSDSVRAHTRRALPAPDGLERIRGLAVRAAGSARSIAWIRRGGTAIHELVAEGVPLPWPELLAAAAEVPFDRDVLRALVEQPDCPHELLLAGLWTTPGDWGRPAPWLHDRLTAGTLTTHDLLTRCPPAALAVLLLAGSVLDKSLEPREWRRADETTSRHVRERLGNSLDAWTIAIRLLPDYPGTLLELLDTAAAVAR
ncbi:hypothetical protein [Embleya sp. NPDC001921]